MCCTFCSIQMWFVSSFIFARHLLFYSLHQNEFRKCISMWSIYLLMYKCALSNWDFLRPLLVQFVEIDKINFIGTWMSLPIFSWHAKRYFDTDSSISTNNFFMLMFPLRYTSIQNFLTIHSVWRINGNANSKCCCCEMALFCLRND